MPRKSFTTETFIAASKEKFGDCYDYTHTVFKTMMEKVVLHCNKHNHTFEITPQSHLKSKTGGCPMCSQELRSNSNTVSSEEFFRRCQEKHNNRYDYSEAIYTGTRNKITIICPVHGRFEQIANEHVRGAGCPKCHLEQPNDSCRGTKEEFVRKAREAHGDKYDYSQFVYVNYNTKGIIVCPEHGPFEKSPSHHLRGQGCPRCSKHNQQHTQEEVIAECRAVHGDTYDLSKVIYRGCKHKITVGCHEHGDFEIGWNHFLQGQGCPKCRYIKSAKSKTKTTEQYITEARAIWGDRYDYSHVNYTHGHDKVEIICKEHGPFWQMANNHINKHHAQGCPVCGKESVADAKRYTTNDFIHAAQAIHGDYYDYRLVNYTHSKCKVDIICPKHGVFTQCADNHVCGQGCPKCGMSTPYYERELTDLIQSRGYKVEQHDREVLDGLELDIYVPELKFAIECDGIFWHNEQRKDKNYHLDKTKRCESKGVRLFHIFDDEWKNKKEIVLSMVSNIIGGGNETVLHARKCEIREVSASDATTFLDANHLQGAVGSQIRYGLYYNNELVSLMTFGKTRHFIGGNNAEYELLRFCNKLNTRVIGGASKLFKHFICTINPNSVISYADRRWSIGNLYDKLGFTLYNKSKPNYYYIVGTKRMNRFNFRKSELVRKYNCPADMSEHEFCLSQGWYRIYDCGCLCYRWDKQE